MNKILLLMPLAVSLSAIANQDNQAELTKVGMKKIQSFAQQLKSTLQSGVKHQGLPQGIDICHSSAQGIAEQYSKDGWSVGRTSLKLRNPSNAPDHWEIEQLKAFEQKYAQGATINTLITSEIITQENGEKYFRLMKAIPTKALCLKCHGTEISEEVKEKLNRLYPDDKATGYQAGQIRGAFTLTKKLAGN